MKLTKEELNGVAFKAKGKWYDGEEVDDFIDELVIEVEKENVKKHELIKKVKYFEELVAKLALNGEDKERDKTLINKNKRKKEDKQVDESAIFELMVCDEIIKERNRLIEEVRQLKKEKKRLQKHI